MLFAAGIQYRMGSSALESELEMLEHERREIEIKTSITEMKQDISRLSKLSAAETLLSDPLSPQRYSNVTGLVSPDLERRSPSQEVEAFDLDGANAVEARYDIGLYPCYVISLTDLCELDVVQPHEELLKVGKLRVLTPRTRRPSCAFTYFVSHNWDQPDFPDNKRNTKLRWLKGLRMHLNLDDESEVWLWWDYISIPQRNRKNQIKAISSIVHYVHLCSRFLPLVRDEAEWHAKEDDAQAAESNDAIFPGTLQRYLRRGWCRVELLAAMCPRYSAGKGVNSDSWRPGPLNLRFRFHHNPADSGIGPVIDKDMLWDPSKGELKNEADRPIVVHIVRYLAKICDDYVNSSSTAWDLTMDVQNRPQWLKDVEKQRKIEMVGIHAKAWIRWKGISGAREMAVVSARVSSISKDADVRGTEADSESNQLEARVEVGFTPDTAEAGGGGAQEAPENGASCWTIQDLFPQL